MKIKSATHGLLLLVACFGLYAASEEVTFPDPALEVVVRKALDKAEGPIQTEDLANLQELSIYATEVRDLTGLEHCVNLIGLNAQSNKIDNIDALAQLTQLRNLVLNNNAITNLAPLAGLVDLEHLSLGGNPFETFEPIAALTKLDHLGIGAMGAKDFEKLSGLTGLETLFASEAGLNDLEFLRGMVYLSRLEAPRNNIESLEPLRELRNLTLIELNTNRISDISPLSQMAQIQRIDLSDNRITSLEGFPPLAPKSVVLLSTNRITDIQPLVAACGFSGGVNLELGQNPLTTESFCRDIPALIARKNFPVYRYDWDEEKVERFPDLSQLCETADLTNTELMLSAVNSGMDGEELRERFGLGVDASASPHEKVRFTDANLERAVREQIGKPSGPILPEDLAAIDKLNAGYESIVDLTGLELIPNLKTLNISGNQIVNLRPLADLQLLENLFLLGNRVEDLRPLSALRRLDQLNVDDNPISDLGPLVEIPALRKLSINRLPVADPSAIAELIGLTELSVGGLGLESIAFTSYMKHLSRFRAPDNRIASLEPLRDLRNLIEIDLSGNEIQDLAPIVASRFLYRLDLRNNRVTDLKGIPPFGRQATVLLGGNQITGLQPLLDACGHTDSICVELGRNQLEAAAFCRDIPELQARGHQVVFEFDFPLEKATRFPELELLCTASARTDGAQYLAAANGGATTEDLIARFGNEAEAPETLAVAAVAPGNSSPTVGSSAALDVSLADTQFNVSLESTGLDLKSLLGAIIFLGVGVMLVIAWRLPRAQ